MEDLMKLLFKASPVDKWCGLQWAALLSKARAKMAEQFYTVASDSEPLVKTKHKLLSLILQSALILELQSAALQFGMTLDIGVRPFIAALVNNVWRATTPEEVLAIFLLELKGMAEMHLKRPIRNAVLTIPVSFSRFQHTRIERACAMAGLHVLRLMPEPTSVALLYAQQQQQLLHENMGSGCEKVALIFNMGADKSLLGCPVGGEDILQNVLRHLLPNLDSFCADHSIEKIKSMGLLRIATQDAIHKLSRDRTSTSMWIWPMGPKYLEPWTNQNSRRSLDLLTIQATPLSLGIRADGDTFVPIIHRNTAIPARKEVVFTTSQDNQTEALIAVYEGEGMSVVETICWASSRSPHSTSVEGTAEISVCMDIDAANVLRVLAGVLMPGGKRALPPFIEVRMPTLDHGHGWCGQALVKLYGTALDLATIPKKMQR
uniref:Uncharacterized protein n=1 Tax=Ananas comosus var. bracteatus TaxID=296719 RepID=A0A6V7Q369_ANACO|nr:unnamed protein product [Ananas comosus var. bracteatus]